MLDMIKKRRKHTHTQPMSTHLFFEFLNMSPQPSVQPGPPLKPHRVGWLGGKLVFPGLSRNVPVAPNPFHLTEATGDRRQGQDPDSMLGSCSVIHLDRREPFWIMSNQLNGPQVGSTGAAAASTRSSRSRMHLSSMAGRLQFIVNSSVEHIK